MRIAQMNAEEAPANFVGVNGETIDAARAKFAGASSAFIRVIRISGMVFSLNCEHHRA
jgi:hypothetical protein